MGEESSLFLNGLSGVSGYRTAAQFVGFEFNRSAVVGFASNLPTPGFP